MSGIVPLSLPPLRKRIRKTNKEKKGVIMGGKSFQPDMIKGKSKFLKKSMWSCKLFMCLECEALALILVEKLEIRTLVLI